MDVTLTVAENESVTCPAWWRPCKRTGPVWPAPLPAASWTVYPWSIGPNYLTLFVTLPGLGVSQSSYNSTPSYPSKALVFNVNGASFNINNTKIDGAPSINPWLPHESAYVPTLEAIESVNVVNPAVAQLRWPCGRVPGSGYMIT